jgi:hypothetical protein
MGLKMEHEEMERRRKLRERQSYEDVLKGLLARRKDKIS